MAVAVRVFVNPPPAQLGLSRSANDRSATFAEMYRWFRPDLVALCRRLLPPGGDPEAVAQEAFTRAWASIDRFTGARPFWPWVATIARRLCIDELRRSGREYRGREYLLRTSSDDTPRPEELVLQRDDERSAMRALRTLAPRDQRLITMCDLNGWSYEEIATFEGVTVEAVRGLLKRARASLRRAFEGSAPALGGFAPVAAFRRLRARLAIAWFNRSSGRPAGSPVVAPLAEAMATTLTLLIVSATAAPGAIAASGAPLLQAAAAQTQPAPVATGSAGGAAEPAGRSAAPAVAAGASKAESHDAAAPGAPARPDLPGGLALPSDGAKHPDGAHFDQVVASSDGSVLFASGTARLSCPAVSCPVLFRSIDGGEHWARLPAAGFLGGELLLPPDPSDRRLFAASNLALQVSSNGGDSFETVPAVGGPAAMSPLFDAGDPTILIGGGPRWEYDASAGTSTPAALVLPTASAVTRFAFSPDNRRDHLLFAGTTAAGSQGAVYRCVDKLCDHSVSLPGLRATPFVAVSPRFAEDRRVWVWSGTSLFRSDDRGLSYQAIPLPTDGSVGSLVLSGPSAYLGLWKDQRGAGGGLFRTDDGGATWHAVATDERFSEGVTGLAVTGDRLVAAVAAPLDRPSLLWSADGGATWDAAR